MDDKSPTESGDTDNGASKQADHEAMEAIQANIIAGWRQSVWKK